MGLVTCNYTGGSSSGPDKETLTFSSGQRNTEVGESDIVVMDRVIEVNSWSLSAAVAPDTGSETVILKHVDPVTPTVTTLGTAILAQNDQISTGGFVGGPFIIPAGHGLQAEITQVNGSKQLSLMIHYTD